MKLAGVQPFGRSSSYQRGKSTSNANLYGTQKLTIHTATVNEIRQKSTEEQWTGEIKCKAEGNKEEKKRTHRAASEWNKGEIKTSTPAKYCIIRWYPDIVRGALIFGNRDVNGTPSSSFLA